MAIPNKFDKLGNLIPLEEPLTLTAKTANSKVKLTATGSPVTSGLKYRRSSKDNWQKYIINTEIPLENIDDYVQFKNEKNQLSTSESNFIQFAISGNLESSGNIQSMLNYSLSCMVYCYFNLFSGCSDLLTAPNLPSLNLANNCYLGMFRGCSSLTSAPELPATNLKYKCYQEMFSYCSSLTVTPELPATTLYTSCYSNMFSYCSSLTKAPELPATTLAYACYYEMFRNCTSLTVAPELLATTLADSCYIGMFGYCSSLTKAPELPATTLAPKCYWSMFAFCTSLTKAPKLPAPTLTQQCYYYMFNGCSHLTEIEVSFIDWNSSNNSTTNWLLNVAPTGIFVKYPGLLSEFGINKIPNGWTIYEPLTFTATENNSKVSLVSEGNPSNPQIKYRTNGKWQEYTIGTEIELSSIGDSVQFWNENNYLSNDYLNYFHFVMSGEVSADGNVQSMINFSDSCVDYCFYALFNNCSSLVKAPKLPCTNLAFRCYSIMFEGCTSLSKTPELPATNLSELCYSMMFKDCSNLTKAKLLATNLGLRSCKDMFIDCNKLNSIEVSFTNWNSSSLATQNWVENVAEKGTFIKPDSLPEQFGVDYIPSGWIIRKPMTLIAEEDGSSVKLIAQGSPTMPDLKYRVNDGNWLTYTIGTKIDLLLSGNYIQFLNNDEFFSQSLNDNYFQFEMSGKISASENIQSLLNYSEDCKANCFNHLFENCSSLINASGLILPSNNLATNCYLRMFQNCTSLTEAPELPATTLANNCYQEMFRGCTSLITAPELPATTLAPYCYYAMFLNCSSLTDAPFLPATNLVGHCYQFMFGSCTSLSGAPSLPATTLEDTCYSNMFSSTALTKAPELPTTTTLVNNCYRNMFLGCFYLKEIDVNFTDWNDSLSSTLNWVNAVAPTGIFIKPLSLSAEYGISRIPNGWEVRDPLTFTAAENDSKIKMVNIGSPITSGLQYRRENESWTDYIIDTFIDLPNEGDSVQFRNNSERLSIDDSNYVKFMMIGKINGDGNIQSLLNFSNQVYNYCFYKLFQGCTSLITAPKLPVSEMVNNCYYGMFQDCTLLSSAPELPASGLATNCYYSMFQGCTSLINAPILSATTLAVSCYGWMFTGCTSLITAPELPATNLAQSCYIAMFMNCTNLTNVSDLSATILYPYCYQSMFGYTKLINAPKIYATTLATQCCFQMFAGCASLINPPELPATTLTNNCYQRMFAGCRSLQKAPKLPASSLTDNCYSGMFNGCWVLNEIDINFTNWNSTNSSTYDWVTSVSSSGIFTKPTSLPIEYGNNYIPSGWTIREPLTFIAEENNCKIKIIPHGSPAISQLKYRTNINEDWQTYTLNTEIDLPNIGDSIQFWNESNQFSQSLQSYVSFAITGEISANGNIQSLLNYSDSCPAWCFYELFNGCTTLTKAPKLEAITLSQKCYSNMFEGCTSLTKVKIDAINLNNDCCYQMFINCTKLNNIEVSFTTWQGTDTWVQNVSPTGSFIKSPTLSAEYGTSRIPNGWNSVSLIDYIESTGTQYIDTGVAPDFANGDKIVIHFYGADYTGTSPCIVGTRESGILNGFYSLGYDTILADSEGHDTIKMKLYGGEHILSIDDSTVVLDGTSNENTRHVTCKLPVFLFALNNYGTSTYGIYSGMQLYDWKYYRNGVLAQHLVPALDQNNVPCLFDTISNTFKYNAGTGIFNYSPHPGQYLEYIESTGTQYIDTGVIPDYANGDKVEISFYLAHPENSLVSVFGSRAATNNVPALSGFYLLIDTRNNLNSFYCYKYVEADENEYIVGTMNTALRYWNDNMKTTVGNNMVQDSTDHYAISANMSKQITSQYSVYLFALNQNGSLEASSFYTGMKLYYWKYWHNGTLTQHLIPVLDNNFIPCLYDLISENYYYNAGSGEFIYN